MVKILFIILFMSTITLGQTDSVFVGNTLIRDTKPDSIVKTSWYTRVMPYAVVTGSGSSIPPTGAQFLEVGKSYGVIDIGLAFGNYSMHVDTTSYVEFKITMDASQYGELSNEFNIGAGRIFNSSTPLILEASYTIMAQVYDRWGIGANTGFYDFVGSKYDITRAYYGIFIRWGLPRNSDGDIYLNKTRGKRRKKGSF